MDLSRQTLIYSLTAGVVSATLYLLAVSGGFFSLLIVYLPLLPLLAIGLWQGSRSAALAALFATFLCGGLISVPTLVFYGLIYAVPCVFFLHATLTRIGEKGWYPVGGALTGLCLYAAIIMIMLLPVILQDVSSLEEVIPTAEMGDSPMMERARDLLLSAPFLIFSMIVWTQILMFYAAAVFANFMLAGWHKALRPSIALAPFMPSLLILVAMLVAGLLSFSETLGLQIAGKTAFLILLMPYFLMGIAQMHARSSRWPQRRLWIFAVYALTILVFWPVFWFIGSGLYEQAKFLSNRHGGGTDA